MKTGTTWLVGTIALTMTLFAGKAFAGKTCEEQEAKEAERLATAAGKCEEELLDKGCDASACQVTAECVPDPVARPQCVFERSQRGNVIDLRTCLVWERKDDGGGLHDVDKAYLWACRDAPTPEDFADGAHLCQPTQEASDACFAGATIYPAGPDADRTVGCRPCDTSSGDFNCAGNTRTPTIWEWILEVNAEGLDGHNDWRIAGKGELESLLAEPFECTVGPPCVDPVIGPTRADTYWSSTTAASFPKGAFHVTFSSGGVNLDTKNDSDFFVRAVRGGL